MGVLVFAENMGLFHKGSGGKGIAPADVCLTPPPPPAGPVPVPYVNVLSAADLANGSKTVKVEGQPTALEDSSYVSTSTGDEAGTQGGNVVTHKTKGKGYFTLWSFTVKIEGKGVCRHGDMMGQNSASTPPGCVDASAVTAFKALSWVDEVTPCPPDSYPGNAGTNEAQQDACRGGPCWECKKPESGYGARKSKVKLFRDFKANERFTPDHQPPQKTAWYMGGCHDPAHFKQWAESTASVKPHCSSCSPYQGGIISHVTVPDIRGWT
ncbi:DUF4150 domain-containing protein [Myxococcus sp. AM011]|nr:DUF4150 domain-containing protein [Myxococcus sp. AM011]